MNKVSLTGRLTNDAKMLDWGNSNRYALKFTLAVDREYKNANGEKEADFIPVIYFISNSTNLTKYLVKGKLVAVTGRLNVYSFTNEDNSKKYYTNVEADEIQFLDNKKKEEAV
ncbi:MAG: single-stranded DNA-binding protein [Bacillota bacterium]|nr:single-stranded DNA-binding protein [Bacillota bacterium]